MVTKRIGAQCCPKCKQTDFTDFSRCRHCGTKYDARLMTTGRQYAWLTADLPYAAPSRRFLGHVLDGIIGTVIVGTVWIALCFTGTLGLMLGAQGAVTQGKHADASIASTVAKPIEHKSSTGSTSPPASTGRESVTMHPHVHARAQSANSVHLHPSAKSAHASSLAVDSKSEHGSNRLVDSGSAHADNSTVELKSDQINSFLKAIPMSAYQPWIPGYDGNGLSTSLRAPIIVFSLLWYILMWLYTAGFQTGPWQATPGQALVGCKVTDIFGARINFARASARYCASVISDSLGFLGYITVLFTERKQTLHDMLSGCVVLLR